MTDVRSCDQCGAALGVDWVRTATRNLCATCAARLDATAAGLIVGGSSGSAIATAGWLDRLSEWRRRR